MLQLSPSKILMYLQCPFKYKCESDYEVKSMYKQDWPEPTFGHLIHACLNDYFSLPEDQRSFDTLRQLLQKKFMANYAKHVRIFKTQQSINEHILEAHKQFKTFLASEFVQGNLLPMEEKLQKYQINQELKFIGMLDRIDIDENRLTIIDYKTGKLREEKNGDTKLQMDCYEYLISKKYPHYKVARKVLFLLRENKSVEPPVVGDLDSIEKTILSYAETIKNDTEMKPRKNALCDYCDYRVICPLFRKN
ncbi:PD-(D/E)XK nuclease family protein [Candidatus Roizmanbacteria bacterium]|nr:PD-(D/E)XK nuclease family protein [Candidatus Roizmanbacteria bacterium]